MHGLIFAELKKFVETKFSVQAWPALLEQAGLKGQHYLTASVYPDQHMMDLVITACKMTGLSANELLQDFGEFVAPDLVDQYKFVVDPKWTLLDFLENTEGTIHKIVRLNKGVTPPRLVVQRLSPDALTITYNSQRRMCALLKGIIKGAARYYREDISLLETRCMLKGDSECMVTVRMETTEVDPAKTAQAALQSDSK